MHFLIWKSSVTTLPVHNSLLSLKKAWQKYGADIIHCSREKSDSGALLTRYLLLIFFQFPTSILFQ